MCVHACAHMCRVCLHVYMRVTGIHACTHGKCAHMRVCARQYVHVCARVRACVQVSPTSELEADRAGVSPLPDAELEPAPWLLRLTKGIFKQIFYLSNPCYFV